MKTKIINLSDIRKNPNLSLSARDYLYDYRVVLPVRASLAKELQRFLDLGEDIDIYAESVGRDEVLHVFTAKFDNGFEADIKVCVSETGCFIDPVMFNENGSEVCVLDCEDELIGDYTFEYDGETYLVDLIFEEEYQEEDTNTKIDFSLESKLANLSFKFQNLESELSKMNEVWDFIVLNYNGHPLTNIDEFISDVKSGKFKEFI